MQHLPLRVLAWCAAMAAALVGWTILGVFLLVLLIHRSSLGVEDVDRQWLQRAGEVGATALASGNFPVGAVLVLDGTEVAAAANRAYQSSNLLQHAELNTLPGALAVLGRSNFEGLNVTLYTTKQPCPLCRGLSERLRVQRIVAGDSRPLWEELEPYLRYLWNLRVGVAPQIQHDLTEAFERTKPR